MALREVLLEALEGAVEVGSASRFFCTVSQEYMTVEWCLSLKSLPISG